MSAKRRPSSSFVKAITWLSYDVEQLMENSIVPVHDLSKSASGATANIKMGVDNVWFTKMAKKQFYYEMSVCLTEVQRPCQQNSVVPSPLP